MLIFLAGFCGLFAGEGGGTGEKRKWESGNGKVGTEQSLVTRGAPCGKTTAPARDGFQWPDISLVIRIRNDTLLLMSDFRPMPVVFFRTAAGNEPVREWLKALPAAERRRIGEDLNPKTSFARSDLAQSAGREGPLSALTGSQRIRLALPQALSASILCHLIPSKGRFRVEDTAVSLASRDASGEESRRWPVGGSFKFTRPHRPLSLPCTARSHRPATRIYQEDAENTNR